jgi:glutaminyl-tRNA synthetase
MVCALYLSVKKLGLPQACLDCYRSVATKLIELPHYTLRDTETLLAFMRQDKKNADGEVEEIYAEYDPESKSGKEGANRKVKGTLHWVSADHCEKAEVRIYDRLFNVEDPSSDERDFRELLNPESLRVLDTCYVEPYAAERKPGEYLQFQRIGYFMADLDSTPEHLVFNKTVSLKDTWAKIKN